MLNLFRKGLNSWYYRKEEARERELEFTSWLYQQWWQNLQPGAHLNDPSSPKQQRRPPLSCLTQNIVRKSTWNDRHANPPYITPLYMHSPRCLVLNEHSHSSCPELRYSFLFKIWGAFYLSVRIKCRISFSLRSLTALLYWFMSKNSPPLFILKSILPI